jgi:hypothetical protein
VLVLLVGAASAACIGSARITARLDVRSPDEVAQTLDVEGTGLVGAALAQAAGPDGGSSLRRQGWEVVSYRPGPDTRIVARRTVRGELRDQPAVGGGLEGGSQSLVVEEGLFSRDYRYWAIVRSTAPPTPVPTPGPAGSGAGLGQAAQAMAEAAIQVRFTVTAPGEVLETNADEPEPGGGTWRLGMAQLQAGRTLTLVTRERKEAPRVALVVVLLGLAFAVGAGVLRAEHAGPAWSYRERAADAADVLRRVGCVVAAVAAVAAVLFVVWWAGSSAGRVPVVDDVIGWLLAVPTPTPAPPLELPRR